MRRHSRTQGQALVEFALAATLIFFLLAAVVDIGLMMFAMQGLHNAAQEGASYGSRWLVYSGNQRVLNVAEIRNRVRAESGDKGGIGFANLLDLNGDGINDSTQSGVVESQITVEMLADPTADGDPTRNVETGAAESKVCADAAIATTEPCYIRVTVRSVHNMLFPFAPAFSRVVPLRSAYIMPIRDSVSRGASGGSSTTTQQCTVPNLIGLTVNNAYAQWNTAGFTGDMNTGNRFNGNNATKPIESQSLTAGASVDCTSSITVSR